MTETWIPKLDGRPGPRYLAIVNALSDAVQSGELDSGVRLPTQRELATRLGVTVGTVGRAYAEAERRQLISAHVGRGTFVRQRRSGAVRKWIRSRPSDREIDLGVNHPVTSGGTEGELTMVERAFARSLAQLTERPGFGDLLTYQPPAGMDAHRRAGAEWLSRAMPDADASRVVVTAGAQNAMAACLLALTRPGDVVMVEATTFPGIFAVVEQFHLRLAPVAMDEHGLIPESLDEVCRATGSRVLYCIPTIHNPTTITLSVERRRRIAEVAERHGIAVVEDDVYAPLPDPMPTPIAAELPELGFYISDLCKPLAPGLRIGFLHVPAARVDDIVGANQTMLWMVAPALAEVASSWIGDGTVDEILAWRRAEARSRLQLAHEVLGDGFDAHENGYHLWLELPDGWRPDVFVAVALRRGVRLTPTEAFVAGDAASPRRVRVCLGVEYCRERLERGLRSLRGLLDGPSTRRFSVV